MRFVLIHNPGQAISMDAVSIRGDILAGACLSAHFFGSGTEGVKTRSGTSPRNGTRSANSAADGIPLACILERMKWLLLRA